MAELTREHLIEIRIGSGDPQSMRVQPGESLGPTLLGTRGAWRVDAPGVAPEHAELYFDGGQLFVRSVSPGALVLVGGSPVPEVWTPLDAPSEIVLGGARLWFGPSMAAQQQGAARVAREDLLEDDDDAATNVADTSARPWGDVGAMVQRGMEAARSQGAPVAHTPPPEPPPPKPAPSFWPTSPAAQSAPPGPPHDAGAIGGPSKTSRSDDSGMTRIEPVEEVAKRRDLTASGSNYPRADLSTSGSKYPRPGHLSTSGSNYPRVAPPSHAASYGAPLSSDGRPTLSEPPGLGGTEVLEGSPLPAPPLRSSPQGAPPTFGAPPNVPAFGAPPSPGGMPMPPGGFARQTGMHPQAALPPQSATSMLPSDFARQTGMHPQAGLPPQGAASMLPNGGFARQTGMHPQAAPPFGMPNTVAGLERAEPGAKKSAWQALSGPKKILVFLSPLLLLAVAVLFFGEELGIEPTPGRGPQAESRGAATSTSTAQPTGTAAPTATAEATPPAAAPPVDSAAAATAAPSAAPTEAPPASPAPSSARHDPAKPQGRPAPIDAPEPASKTPPGSKSLQRRAADAVAVGAYAQAAELYEQLAKENPNKPAYAEAAAILRAKAGQK